jgi:hypothetical protein
LGAWAVNSPTYASAIISPTRPNATNRFMEHPRCE